MNRQDCEQRSEKHRGVDRSVASQHPGVQSTAFHHYLLQYFESPCVEFLHEHYPASRDALSAWWWFQLCTILPGSPARRFRLDLCGLHILDSHATLDRQQKIEIYRSLGPRFQVFPARCQSIECSDLRSTRSK